MPNLSLYSFMAISNASFSLYPFCRCRSTQSSNPLARNGMGSSSRMRGARTARYVRIPHGRSSPRMRGALPRYQARFLRQGIIPADAGSTGFRHCKGHARRDHPRVCGEHVMIQGVFCAPTGSSPRMRGAPNHRGFTSPWVGIIPAYAGSTRW